MKFISSYLTVLGLLSSGAFAAVTVPKEPIYIYFYARVTDQVNLDVTEDRLRRVLPMVEKYRKNHPEAHVSATILFSGAVSRALADRNGETHILDFVRDYIRRGVIEPGYDGTDEPTYENRPVLNFFDTQTAEGRWLLREAADEKLLAEARDPLTGALQPGRTGGLKGMEEAFGKPACITGLTLWMNATTGGARVETPSKEETSNQHSGQASKETPNLLIGLQPEVGGDSELVEVFNREHITALMFGIADSNPARIPGFQNGKAGFGGLMSPIPEAAPEVYWQDNVLRSSEGISNGRLVHASDGADAIKTLFGKADRSRIHVIHVELASDQNYLQPGFIKGPDYPPVKYAYSHPGSPKLPTDALLAATAIDAAYAKEDGTLKWLTDEFFPADPGSRAVSSTELMQMASPSTGFSISTDSLRAALADFLKKAGNSTFLPPIFQADGHYLSLADMFQVMTDVLAEFGRTGKFPESVNVVKVYGPVRLYTGHGPNAGEVTIASIARVCAQIDGALHDQSPSQIPKNAIPSFLTVEGIQMNPAQFLRLMANALVTPSPETKLPVRMTYGYTATLELYPKARRLNDAGFGWTFKPAPLATKLEGN